MWFIGVEVVEQETSAPPPKKNPGSAPGQLHITSHFGGEAKFVPVTATLPILGLKFIKLFCAFLWAILWFSCAKNCG